MESQKLNPNRPFKANTFCLVISPACVEQFGVVGLFVVGKHQWCSGFTPDCAQESLRTH